MNTYVNYMIEANLGICFFMLVYKLFVEKETDFSFKRGYLLLALLVSLLAPLLHLNTFSSPAVNTVLNTFTLPEIQVTSQQTGNGSAFTLSVWIFTIYAIGALIALTTLIFQFAKIVRSIYGNLRENQRNFCLIELPDSAEIFSFFKFIFIGQSVGMSEKEKRQIILHEQVHVEHYHSVDILFVKLLAVVFWFNPLLKAYRNALIQLHEFEADARSVAENEVEVYCSLLAKAALRSSGYQLANHFTNSLTLKRIKMMKTMKTKIGKWKAISVVGVALAFCFWVVGNNIAIAQGKKDQKTDEVFDQVDEMPTFGTGPQYNELYNFIGKNLVYPKEAKEAKIEGKVYAQFVVQLDGSLSNIKILKGIGHGCDESVQHVLRQMPKWNPGEIGGKSVRTKMVLPVIFKI